MQEFPLPFWEKNKSNNHKLAEKIQSNKYFHHEQTKHFHQYKMDTILEKTKVCKIGWSHGLVISAHAFATEQEMWDLFWPAFLSRSHYFLSSLYSLYKNMAKSL